MRREYYGHATQVFGVEEHRLVGGKGDGMRLFLVRNGKGLEFTVSADRCADIARLSYDGINMGYFGPCGYVAPSYFDGEGFGFLKSFTVGFLTTCGLSNIGTPSVMDGEPQSLHGTISNTPAENVYFTEDEEGITIHALINDSHIFKTKFSLKRTIWCSKRENKIKITDVVTNEGSKPEPAMLLYHLNMGYPLLSEEAELSISSDKVTPRDERAKEGINVWNVMEKPQPNFVEQCYYHFFDKEYGTADIFNKEIGKGLRIKFPTDTFKTMVEWKMMGEKDYVLGLEPSTNLLDGVEEVRKTGELSYLHPSESKTFRVEIDFFDAPEK